MVLILNYKPKWIKSSKFICVHCNFQCSDSIATALLPIIAFQCLKLVWCSCLNKCEFFLHTLAINNDLHTSSVYDYIFFNLISLCMLGVRENTSIVSFKHRCAHSHTLKYLNYRGKLSCESCQMMHRSDCKND